MPAGSKPGERRGGRKKGVPNRTTALLKDAILKAAEEAGGKGRDGGLVGYLMVQAIKNPGPFMSLLGKVLPMQIANDGEEAFRIAMEITRETIVSEVDNLFSEPTVDETGGNKVLH